MAQRPDARQPAPVDPSNTISAMIGDGARAAVLATVLALAYFAAGVFTAGLAGDPQHLVMLELDEERTTWPWPSSIQRASAEWINSPDNAQPTSATTVEALEPENTTELELVATAASAEEARRAAETVAAEFLSHDFALQLEPFQTRRDAIQSVFDELRSEFDEQEQSGTMASNNAEITARSERLEGTAATLGGLEGDLERVEEELAAVEPRYSLVESEPVSPWRERLPETAKLFGGVLILGWLVLQIALPRFGTTIGAD